MAPVTHAPMQCQTGVLECVQPMSRDLPHAFSPSSESRLAPHEGVSSTRNQRRLSVLPAEKRVAATRLTRSQVASRLGVSVSTVRRLEGERLHPIVDDKGVRWFDENEVAALAAELVNDSNPKQSRTPTPSKPRTPDPRSAGEIASLVFERLEQRQSLAEIVIGLRVEPETVRALFEQWCLGLTEGQLRMEREPRLPRAHELERARLEK